MTAPVPCAMRPRTLAAGTVSTHVELVRKEEAKSVWWICRVRMNLPRSGLLERDVETSCTLCLTSRSVYATKEAARESDYRSVELTRSLALKSPCAVRSVSSGRSHANSRLESYWRSSHRTAMILGQAHQNRPEFFPVHPPLSARFMRKQHQRSLWSAFGSVPPLPIAAFATKDVEKMAQFLYKHSRSLSDYRDRHEGSGGRARIFTNVSRNSEPMRRKNGNTTGIIPLPAVNHRQSDRLLE